MPGFALCKDLVEAHGGRIPTESGGLGPGTRISFTIPATEESGVIGNRRNLPLEEWKDSRIPVVDDDSKMRWIGRRDQYPGKAGSLSRRNGKTHPEKSLWPPIVPTS